MTQISVFPVSDYISAGKGILALHYGRKAFALLWIPEILLLSTPDRRIKNLCTGNENEIDIHNVNVGTAKEAAEILGVTPHTIYMYAAQKRIRSWRVGPRNLRIDLDSVVALIQPNH